MDSQTTPFHKTLWHKGFWALAVANLLLTMSVYMMIPVVTDWLQGSGMSALECASVMGAYGVGLFLMGPFCSYFIQRFRRNHVCELAILLLGLCFWLFGMMQQNKDAWEVSPFLLTAVRLFIGTLFGLAQMVLSSTLVIDVCESFQRTHANHAAAWFSRLALCLGPLAALLLPSFLSTVYLYWVMVLLCVVAAILIQMVTIPFRAPSDDYSSFSLDRFFLPSSWRLFLLQVAFGVVVSSFLAEPYPWTFYVMMMLGLAVAVLMSRSVLNHTDLRVSTTLSFIILIGVMPLLSAGMGLPFYLAALFTGAAIGVVSNNFLTYFLNLSDHCQRGTSQSSYFLSWELGISLGLFLFFLVPAAQLWARVLLIVCVLCYYFLIHPWYLRHKVR